MSRLVVISNRLADPRKPAAGGLAVALGEALNQTGGLWFGWSGTVVEGGTPGEGELHTRQAGAVTLATVDLCREDHDSYYHGYSNSVLWPVFHYRLDLADFNASYIAGYRRVNQMFARKLLPLLRDDDVRTVEDEGRQFVVVNVPRASRLQRPVFVGPNPKRRLSFRARLERGFQ